MKVRVRFSKMGVARFFSHLDLQRTLERTLRRAGIPVAYSQGFTPHPRISFASALATGATSEGEFMDVELSQEMSLAEFLDRANACSPAGLQFLEARQMEGKGDALMSLLDAAAYRLTLAGVSLESLQIAVATFMALEHAEITRDGRTGPRQVNIRPQVYGLEVTGPCELRAVLATGQMGNLKPSDLVIGLRTIAVSPDEFDLSQSHRLMLYRRNPQTGALREPWEL